VHPASLQDRDEQALVSLHERLHHELQHTTLWGLIARFSADLARLKVEPERFRRLARFCRSEARLVHETYATTISVGVQPIWKAHLGDQGDYLEHYRRGMTLAPGASWELDRFAVDAVLRGTMCAADLRNALASGLGKLRIADLNPPTARPDARLATLLNALDDNFSWPDPAGLTSRSTTNELGAYFDEISVVLDRAGVPTLRTADVRELIGGLFDDIAVLSPDLRSRIELDERVDHILDDLEEHQRERIQLHADGPLPVVLIDPQALPDHVDAFARDHDRLGVHLVLVWARADILAAQFRRPNPLEAMEGHVLGLQAAGYDEDDQPIVRLSLFPTDSPAYVARLLGETPLLCLTTSSSLVDAPGTASSEGIDYIVAVADQPIVSQLLHTFDRSARVIWTRGAVDGYRKLHIFAYQVNVLPGIIWLQFATEAGRQVTTAWLESLPKEQADKDPDAFKNVTALIDAAVQHVTAAWFMIDQQEAAQVNFEPGPSSTNVGELIAEILTQCTGGTAGEHDSVELTDQSLVALAKRLAPDNPDRLIEVVVRLLDEALDDPLALRIGGWKLNVPLRLFQSLVASAVLVVGVEKLGTDSIAVVVLAAVLPFLLEIDKVRISPSEQLVFTELASTLASPKLPQELWAALPDDIRHELTYLEFVDLLDRLEQAGALRKNLDNRYTTRGWFTASLGDS
jgi:hypothetical protein